LKQVSGKDFSKAIQRNGWICVLVKGSHHIFTKTGHRERIVIPIHGNTPLKVGLLHSIMKIAGVSEEEILAKI